MFLTANDEKYAKKYLKYKQKYEKAKALKQRGGVESSPPVDKPPPPVDDSTPPPPADDSTPPPPPPNKGFFGTIASSLTSIFGADNADTAPVTEPDGNEGKPSADAIVKETTDVTVPVKETTDVTVPVEETTVAALADGEGAADDAATQGEVVVAPTTATVVEGIADDAVPPAVGTDEVAADKKADDAAVGTDEVTVKDKPNVFNKIDIIIEQFVPSLNESEIKYMIDKIEKLKPKNNENNL